MKITENFKKALRHAKSEGFHTLRVTKGGHFNNIAVIDYKIDTLLNEEIGTEHNASRGYWLNAQSNHDDVIGYMRCFERYRNSLENN